MANLSGILNEHERMLVEKGEVHLRINDFLRASPPEPQSSHIDLQILDAVEELRRVKAEHIGLRTQELFMRRILQAKSIEDLPSSQETGRAEVSLQEAKRDLRKIKAGRKKADQSLPTEVGRLGTAIRNQSAAREEAALRLKQARRACKTADVRELLKKKDMKRLELLVDDVDAVDGSCCQEVIEVLQKERIPMQRKANQQTFSMGKIRQHVDELQSDVKNLSTQSDRLRRKIAAEDERDPEIAKLRHEHRLQKELEMIMRALTGIRVVGIREHGIRFHLNAALLVPFEEDVDRSKPTHTLDIELDEEEKDQSLISSLKIEPGDIEVADLCNEKGISLSAALQTVRSRLAKLMCARKS